MHVQSKKIKNIVLIISITPPFACIQHHFHYLAYLNQSPVVIRCITVKIAAPTSTPNGSEITCLIHNICIHTCQFRKSL